MITKTAISSPFISKVTDYVELTKPGITFSVVASMLIGFLMGSAGNLNALLLINAVIGTWLIASGTAAHNMFLERRPDELMKRTSKRPLPDQRISDTYGLVFSLSLMVAGLGWLLLTVNLAAGLVSLATTVIYLGAYTPLKRISALNVFVGAVPGALPVVGGWAAATGTIFEHGMWILFGLIFCWQIPHVMSIAWVCRKDYEHAGFQMLPKNDKNGYVTSLWVLLPLIALIPSIYKLFLMNYAGWLFLTGGMGVTLWFLFHGLRFTARRDIPSARSMMFTSFAYLPLVWVFIILDWIIL